MGCSATVMKDLREANECRVEDEQEEEEFQARFGSRPASQVCAGLWKELESLKTYHEQGVRSEGGEGWRGRGDSVV